MKTGDTVPVNIAGDVVAQAKVTEIDKEKNTVTLIVPATRVVMGLKVEIDTTPQQVEDGGASVVITGVDRVDGEGNVVAPVEPAPVQVANTATETPEGVATQTEVVAPVPAAETTVESTPVVEGNAE